MRDLILSGTRPDGRDNKTLRDIELRGRRAAARARLGRLPARRNAGADHRHAGHQPRRAARRRPDRRVLQEVHARLQLPVVLGGRSAADPRPGPARNRPRRPGRAERQAGAARSRGVSLHDPRDLRHSGVERLQLDGQRLRRDAGADGGRRADHAIRWPASRSAWSRSPRTSGSCSPTSSATRTTSATWTSRSPARRTASRAFSST